MKFITGSDGRVYVLREGEWVFAITVDKALAAHRELGDAINVALAFRVNAEAEEKDRPTLPKEVTRELLR